MRRLPHLQLSLAAKCRILFGAAVILIISAALFVPWQRMEQLTSQLNERAAAAMARTALVEHIISERAHPRAATTGPSFRGEIPSTRPSMVIDGEAIIPPRLVPLAAINTPEGITRFEASALQRFINNPKLPFYARQFETNDRPYRYAQPLLLRNECMDCHMAPAAPTTVLAETTVPDESESTGTIVSTTREAPATLLGIVSVDIPSQVSAGQLLLNRVFILTAGLIAGSLAIIIFYLVTTRFILQPVRVLQETAQKVSEGDLNIRSDINTGDEFQVLSETFNEMLANLKESDDQLREVNKSLDVRLGQLAETNVALYESNRLKSEFLANVSHELRTPLNSILGFADLLKDQQSPATVDPKTVRYVQNILSAGHNLLDLINDLLDLAKIEAGRMEVRAEPLSLPDLFEALAGVLKPLTESKNVTIVSSIAPDVPIIETDPTKLQQILYNFLANAIKFSPPGQKIDLAAVLDAKQVRISVRDYGPGIEPAKHGLIFEKFRQVDASVTREHSGTGLGLAISKELSLLLSGSIGLQSEIGAGATFFVTLPLKIEPSHADMRGRLVLS